MKVSPIPVAHSPTETASQSRPIKREVDIPLAMACILAAIVVIGVGREVHLIGSSPLGVRAPVHLAVPYRRKVEYNFTVALELDQWQKQASLLGEGIVSKGSLGPKDKSRLERAENTMRRVRRDLDKLFSDSNPSALRIKARIGRQLASARRDLQRFGPLLSPTVARAERSRAPTADVGAFFAPPKPYLYSYTPSSNEEALIEALSSEAF